MLSSQTLRSEDPDEGSTLVTGLEGPDYRMGAGKQQQLQSYRNAAEKWLGNPSSLSLCAPH